MSTHTEPETTPQADAPEAAGSTEAAAMPDQTESTSAAPTGADADASGADSDATGGDEESTLPSEDSGDPQDGAPRTGSRRLADLEREGEIAADFLETLLDIADLDGDLEVAVEGDRAAVAIVDSEDGPAPQRLVGTGASVLEALQELARLAVQAETGERSRLMLDVANYRAERRATLVGQARRAVADVKDTGERRELEPMSAFERKVVHDEVLAAGLVSESEGEEPHRHVVILPAS